MDVSWNLNEETAFNQTIANQLDESVPPAAQVQGVASKYGVNKARFWTQPVNCTGYLPMNVSRSLFKGNLNLRKAINYAINRKDYVSQAGPYAGSAVDAHLQPGRSWVEERHAVQEEPRDREEAGQGPLQERQDQRRLPDEQRFEHRAVADRPA